MAMEDDALDVEALASRYAGAAKVRVRAALVAKERRMVRS